MNAAIRICRILMSVATISTILTVSSEAADASGRLYYSGLTSSEFQSIFDVFVPQGYRLTYARGYDVNGQARYDVEFVQKSGCLWKSRYGMCDWTFRQKSDYYRQLGYEMTLHNAYRVNGELLHLAIWEKH